MRKLRNITHNEASAAAKCLVCVKYKPGEVVFIQGDVPACLYIVVKGSVDIFLVHSGSSSSPGGSSKSYAACMGAGPKAPDEQAAIRRTFVSYQKALKLFGR